MNLYIYYKSYYLYNNTQTNAYAIAIMTFNGLHLILSFFGISMFLFCCCPIIPDCLNRLVNLVCFPHLACWTPVCSALTLAWHAIAYAITSVLHLCDVDWFLELNYDRIQADYDRSLMIFKDLFSATRDQLSDAHDQYDYIRMEEGRMPC
jgi:hypothetical protein